MLSFGIIAVFKVISLKRGDGELDSHVSFQSFPLSFLVLLSPVKPQDWWQGEDEEPGKMLQGTIFFLKKKKVKKNGMFWVLQKDLSAFNIWGSKF